MLKIGILVYAFKVGIEYTEEEFVSKWTSGMLALPESYDTSTVECLSHFPNHSKKPASIFQSEELSEEVLTHQLRFHAERLMFIGGSKLLEGAKYLRELTKF